MGIDVRWYAQRGQNIVRASCVGCGMCATVCPRGVLRLENGPRAGRYNEPALVRLEEVGMLPQDEDADMHPQHR
jgi:ferredoxin